MGWTGPTLIYCCLNYVYMFIFVTLLCYLVRCGTNENNDFGFEVLSSLFPIFYCNVTWERTICIIDSHFDSSLPNSGTYMYFLKKKLRHGYNKNV